MKQNTLEHGDLVYEASEEDTCMVFPFEQDGITEDYSANRTAPPFKQVIDLLREIRGSQITHEQTAATKDDVVSHTQAVVDALTEQNAELRQGVERLREHLDLFSVRTIFTVISLVLVVFSTVLLLVTLLRGPLVISTPLPHFLLIFSIGLYLMARKLPGRSS